MSEIREWIISTLIVLAVIGCIFLGVTFKIFEMIFGIGLIIFTFILIVYAVKLLMFDMWW